MDTRQLRAFVTVVEHSSFTLAAEALSYAQSSVTSQIRSLEKEVGAELLIRVRGRGLRLTDAGARFLPFARDIIDLHEDAIASTRPPSQVGGSLTIGTMESLTAYRLVPAFEYMHLRYPDLRLSLRALICAEAEQAIHSGELHGAFVMDTTVKHIGLNSLPITEEPLVMIAAPGHPLVGKPDITDDDLRAQRILGTEPGCAYREGLEQHLTLDRSEPLLILEMGSIPAIKRSVASGLGIALLPRATVEAELDAGELTALNWPAPFSITSQFLWRSADDNNPALKALIAAVTESIQAESP